MSAPNVVAIVQARLGSTRLPMKSLLSLRGMPIIDRVAARLRNSRRLSRIIVAIPDTALDAVLGQHLARLGVETFAGPENDVLGRFCGAAAHAGADLVVRVCADNPFVWGEAIDRLVDFYESSELDYAWNHIPLGNTWPDGLGAEILSRELLEKLDTVATTNAQREHCLNYIRDNAESFRMGTFDPVEPWLQRPDIKLDIDCAEDFRRLAMLDVQPLADARSIVTAWDTAFQN